ncbi:MAG: hypothetical protein QM775_04030 [Pirellulales bacterium]
MSTFKPLWSALVCAALVCGGSAHAEDDAPKYPYPVAPAAMLADPGLAELGPWPKVAADELRLLERAYALRDDAAAQDKPEYDRLVADLMFTAGGVSTATELAELHDRLDDVVVGARKAVAARPSDEHAGEALMKFLHAGLLREGYVDKQTSLVETFRTHTYNCVSSSAAYYLVGLALGMKLRVICISGSNWTDGHVCLDLLDGDKTYQLEPTNADGFDWETKINRPGVSVPALSPDRRDGYPTDGLGLVACVYRNRSVGAVNVDPPQEADRPLAASLATRALMCSPYDKSSIHALATVYVNWGPKAAEAGRYEEAIAALQHGLELTNHRDVRNNLGAVGIDWMRHLVDTKQDAAAEAAARRLAKLLSDDSDFRGAALWKRCADDAFEADDGGPPALDVVARALKVADSATHAELKEYRISLLRRWSQWWLAKQNVEQSLAALRRGLEFDATSADLAEGVGYHVQEALAIVDPEGTKPTAAVEHFRAVRKAFPEMPTVAENGYEHARRSLRDLCAAGKFEEALEKAPQYEPLTVDAAQLRSLSAYVWSEWGFQLSEQKKWTDAVGKFVAGLKAAPDDEELLRGATIVVDRWADVSMNEQRWDDAVAAYDYGLRYLPGNGHLSHNREYCLAKKAEAAGK